jgi:hypothetical protein
VLRALARRRPDVLVLDSIAAAFLGPWVGRCPLPPLVAILHQPPGGIDHAAIHRRVQSALDRRAYRHAARLLVASTDLAAALRRAGVSKCRLRVVPPGRDPTAAPVASPRSDLGAIAAQPDRASSTTRSPQPADETARRPSPQPDAGRLPLPLTRSHYISVVAGSVSNRSA